MPLQSLNLNLPRPIKYLREVFSEQDGTGSYARFIGGVFVFSAVAWITYVVHRTGNLPDMTGPTAWAGLGSASHYIPNIFKKDDVKAQNDQSPTISGSATGPTN